MKVRIIGESPGEAPEWVRKQWVGLVLPLAVGEKGARPVRTCGVLTGPKTLWATVWHRLAGKDTETYGFAIDSSRALEILAAHSPEAAEWWRTHTTHWLPGWKFVFPEEVCQELGSEGSPDSPVGPKRQSCPTCGTKFTPHDIDADRLQATCWTCNAVVSLTRTGSPVLGPSSSSLPARRHGHKVARPRHISVRDDNRGLRVRFRWIWRSFTNAACFCLIWNSFLVLWYWSALRTPETRIMWFAIVWSIPFVAVGLLLLYATLAGLLNRTVIRVTSESVTVWHGPMPWWGKRRLRTDELGPLFCDRDPATERRSHSRAYRVNTLTREGSRVDLVSDLDRAEALFIRQELERRVNSHCRRVGREVHS